MGDVAHAHQFDFSGGALCLDFANTLGDRPIRTEEHLQDWTDLVAWGVQAGILTSRDAAELRGDAQSHPQAARRGFAEAVRLRERIYGIFTAVAASRPVDRGDVEAINAELSGALAHARIDARGDGFVWTWAGDGAGLNRILWPVVRSTADLLVSDERQAVRECASGRCSWLFVDRSRTGRRRWCSMKTCGNRDKVRRFYERQK